jgi:hypothetical protein
MTQFADFSAGRPGALALLQNGFGGVIRYVGLGSSGKRITSAEYLDYAQHGVQVALVAEYDTHDSEGGYNRGVANARLALNDARALGIPDWTPIFATADEHLPSSLIGSSVDYVRGFRDVLGLARTGAYGFSEFLSAVRNANMASSYWRSGTEPTAAEKEWTNLWQRNKAPSIRKVNGIICDISDKFLDLGGLMTSLDDTFIPFDKNGKQLWPVSYASAIANVYAMLFYGSHFAPWDGVSLVQSARDSNNMANSTNADIVDLQTKMITLVNTVAQQNGLTADQVIQAVDQALATGAVTVDVNVTNKTPTTP